MTWADTLNDNWILAVSIILILQLPILYSLSPKAKYHIKMFLYYITVFFASCCAAPAAIPTYFQNRGGTNAFKVFNFFASWVDIDMEVRGQEKLEADGSGVLVSNHQSSLDIIAMGKVWPDRCTCMMKKSLAYIPGFNISSFLCNAIFVDRFNHDKACKALESAVKTILEKNLKIWVFPEGTRFKGKGMLPFKKGAFNIAVEAQIPIYPVVVSHYGSFYSSKEKVFKNRGQVIIQVLDPIPTKGLTREDVPTLLDRVRLEMLKEFEKISTEAEERQKIVDSEESKKSR
ncbi:hypothetical protein FO519_006102 [Halicephalobus sp. NKZ332]|nr:hypothetical protein FO519_006102 [Halicephalobus sp. NKZ332]